jgi:hypothetical protein
MNTPFRQLVSLALLGLLAVALLLAPIHANATTVATDRHEIPTFVLDHVELTPGARLRAG